MIIEPWIVSALMAAGHTTGWAVRGEEIVVWDHETPVPTIAELEAALPRD